MSHELLPSITGTRTPLVVVDDKYYPDNEYSKQQEFALKEQILTLTKTVEPWEAETARRFAYGETANAITKVTKKQHKLVIACLNMQAVQDLIALWQAFLRLNILLIFIDKTAAQTAAHARNLLRAERYALLLRHLD